jgi:tripartite-type tricarboxylate transporter receptor subunit TctC
MSLSRRRVLKLATGATALFPFGKTASALDYPTRPVQLVVGYPAGGAPDIISRLMGEWLSKRLGQQFIIDNRPGAGSNIAVESVAKARPDGYTLFMAVSTNAVNATLYAHLSFNFIKDFAPVAGIGGTPFVLVVTPSFPPKTLPEFIAYAKTNAARINMASQGVGTTPEICGELLRMMSGAGFIHVPYRGDLMPDLLAGRVQFYFSPMAQALQYVRDGRLRALGVTTATRSNLLPDVPAIGEFVPGYEAVGWYGICAPAGTPTEIIDKLNKEVVAGVADAKLQAHLLALGVQPKPRTPAEFGKFIADETEKWAKVIKFANIKAE